jgi:putative hemolysin
MLDLIRQPAHESQRNLTFSLARTVAEITEAQRIRFKVFGEEMGANLPSAALGLDIDRFD